jgi:hypothetical protein
MNNVNAFSYLNARILYHKCMKKDSIGKKIITEIDITAGIIFLMDNVGET